MPALPNRTAAEFRDHEWLAMPELAARVVAFRRPVYEAVMEAFSEQLKG